PGRCGHARVFRVCGLSGVARSSGKGGTNFVETMLRLATEGRPIRVVADQVLGPSYTLDLARKVWQILPLAVHPVYHLTNAGATSWHGFARRAFELAGLTPDLRPVTAAEFGARARRPAYSVLGHGNLTALGADDLRPWDAALAAYVAERASAPASAAASPRRSASSKPTAEIPSVRAMMRRSGSRRASTAARILPANSARGITWWPERWPQRLGVIWSSMWSAATPAASYVC